MLKYLIIAISIILFICPNNCFSSEGELRIGIIEIGNPIGYKDEQGEPAGIYADVSKELAKELNVDTDIALMPYGRIIKALKNGSLDCAIFFTGADRKKWFHQVAQVTTRAVVVAGNQSFDASSAKSLKDFYGKTIAAIRETDRQTPFFANENINKYWVETYKQGLEMLALGRVDGFIGAKELIDENYYTGSNYYVVNANSSWLQCSKNSHITKHISLKRLEDAMKKLTGLTGDTNTVLNIHRKYLKNYQELAINDPR